MKRDMDLVRDILLKIEAGNELNLSDLPGKDASREEREAFGYNLGLLYDHGFVTGIAAHTLAERNWLNLSLTWDGHEFLDDIREPAIWKKTKEGATAVGSASLQFMWEMAKAIAKQEAKKRLGLDL